MQIFFWKETAYKCAIEIYFQMVQATPVHVVE